MVLRLLNAGEAGKCSVSVHVCERRCLLFATGDFTAALDALHTLNVVGLALDLYVGVLDKQREEEAHGSCEDGSLHRS